MRALGLEPRTYGLKGRKDSHKYLPYLFLHAFFGVKNQIYSHSILIVNWQSTKNPAETDARMTPRTVGD